MNVCASLKKEERETDNTKQGTPATAWKSDLLTERNVSQINMKIILSSNFIHFFSKRKSSPNVVSQSYSNTWTAINSFPCPCVTLNDDHFPWMMQRLLEAARLP